MNCGLTRDYMMKHFDGEFNDIENAQMKQHLKVCTKCRAEFEELKSTFDFLEENECVQPPEGFEFDVMTKIYDFEAERRKRTSGFLVLTYNLAVLISIALLMTFASGLEGLSVLGIHLGEAADIGFLQALLIEVYSMAKGLGEAVISIGVLFYDTGTAIVDMYYYHIIVIITLIFLIQKTFVIFLKHDRRGA